MGNVFGIDLGTTYSCIAYIDANGMPVVLKNAEGDLTTPSVVFFESQSEVTVGAAAKESAKMYPDQVVTFIKRSIGQPGFCLNLNGINMKPEEISSYILKKVVQDAEETMRMEGKLGDEEHIRNVVITCPAYFGVAEREATKTAGIITGLNVMAIINEPTAAAITYGVTDDSREKTVLVYDLGGGTFDITMIHIKPGEIRVICTGGDHNLGGKDWDDRVLLYLAQQYQQETGTQDDILEDAETLQELSLAAERAQQLLSTKEKAPVVINYMGERVRVDLTRQTFDQLTEDLLSRTIELTREMFGEAEKKGYRLEDVSDVLLVGDAPGREPGQGRVRHRDQDVRPGRIRSQGCRHLRQQDERIQHRPGGNREEPGQDPGGSPGTGGQRPDGRPAGGEESKCAHARRPSARGRDEDHQCHKPQLRHGSL